MPYIGKKQRKILDPCIDKLFVALQRTRLPFDGEVTYAIYRLLKKLYDGEGSGFAVKSNALKILSAVELEYYRRILAPYEDEKIQENGDVL